MSEPAQPVPNILQIELPDEEVAGHYADFAGVWHTPDIFVLDFAALKAGGQPVETESGPAIGFTGRVVARVRIPPNQVFELMKALESQLTAWEQESGQRPHGNGEGFPPVE